MCVHFARCHLASLVVQIPMRACLHSIWCSEYAYMDPLGCGIWLVYVLLFCFKSDKPLIYEEKGLLYRGCQELSMLLCISSCAKNYFENHIACDMFFGVFVS